MVSAGKVQNSLWHAVQRGGDDRKTLKKRGGWREKGRISGEDEQQTHERQRAARGETERRKSYCFTHREKMINYLCNPLFFPPIS